MTTAPASLARAIEGIDTVIHLGARAIFEEYELVRPTIVDGSVALMRAAARPRGQTMGHYLVAHAGRKPLDVKLKAQEIADPVELEYTRSDAGPEFRGVPPGARLRVEWRDAAGAPRSQELVFPGGRVTLPLR